MEEQVEMWLVSKVGTGSLAPGIACAAGERVLVEVSRKFTPQRLQSLAYNSGLFLQVRALTGGRMVQCRLSRRAAVSSQGRARAQRLGCRF